MKILIAEDDHSTVLLYQYIFSEDDVHLCLNGEDFMMHYDDSYDVLIIDIRMTVKDGYEVISFLEGLNNTIPIVVVSACIAYATPDELSKLGDVLIIRKPILTSTLRERIVKYIN